MYLLLHFGFGFHILSPLTIWNLTRHLENNFQLDRGAEWKAGDTVNQPAGVLLFSEDVLQQLRRAVSNFRLIANISRGRHQHAEPDDPRDFVERSQMFARNRKAVERRKISRPPPRFHVKLCADAPNELRRATFRRQHASQKEQIACLHRFHIGAKRLRWRRELDAQIFQPLLGTSMVRAFAAYQSHCRSCIHLLSLIRLTLTSRLKSYADASARIRLSEAQTYLARKSVTNLMV